MEGKSFQMFTVVVVSVVDQVIGSPSLSIWAEAPNDKIINCNMASNLNKVLLRYKN
jgi:hypothetical protein